jgi:hypothetical protein
VPESSGGDELELFGSTLPVNVSIVGIIIAFPVTTGQAAGKLCGGGVGGGSSIDISRVMNL